MGLTKPTYLKYVITIQETDGNKLEHIYKMGVFNEKRCKKIEMLYLSLKCNKYNKYNKYHQYNNYH